MGWWLYTVKTVKTGQNLVWGVTAEPGFDRQWWGERGGESFTVTDGPLPYDEAAVRWERRQRQWPPPFPTPEITTASLTLLRGLEGWLLRERELEKRGRNIGMTPLNVRESLQAAWLLGKIQRWPSLLRESGGYRCWRCGSRSGVREEWCPRCGRRDCPVCGECSALGEVRGCEPLYLIPPADNCRPLKLEVAETRQLTPWQQEAAEQLVCWLREERGLCHRDFLVWAACGAGKTEVIIPVIREAVGQGRRVLYLSPRRDVVRETWERLQGVFPQKILGLHLGGEHQGEGGEPVLLATVHQAVRWRQVFSLVILDEPDAFPYAGNRLLAEVVERAAAPDGRRLYLTATPSPEMQHQLSCGKMGCLYLPARFHGHPLPVPEVVIDPLGRRARQALGILFEQARQGAIPLLIFVPTVASGEKLCQNLRSWFPQVPGRVPFYHARSPGREGWRRVMREKKILVATTILERGINPGVVNVVVWEADHPVFDVASLVQMAGRVGRDPTCPGGSPLFLARQWTPVMKAALEQITKMNKLAEDKGWLPKKTLAGEV